MEQPPNLPYVLVGDDIFPLKPWLMKPFPGNGLPELERIYNYRLSRARRVIENAFDIMSAKWRILRRPIKAGIDQVEGIVKAVVCLHNYLRLTDNAKYIPAGFVDNEDSSDNVTPGEWQNAVAGDTGLLNIGKVGGNRYAFKLDWQETNSNNISIVAKGKFLGSLNIHKTLAKYTRLRACSALLIS